MIIKEKLEVNGKTYIKTYSDIGLQLKQEDTGDIYDEAIDPIAHERRYTEILGNYLEDINN